MTGRLPIRSGTQKVPGAGRARWFGSVGIHDRRVALRRRICDCALWQVAHRLQGRRLSRTIRALNEWWGINEGSNAAAYTSTPQFDPTVAEVPHFWTGVKGKPSTRLEIYDIPAKASLDSRTTAKAIGFIQARSSERTPFYLYVGFTHFHPPWGVHPDFENKSGAGMYADTKMEVDHNIGQVLDAISSAGIANNTIVILTGDNGAAKLPLSRISEPVRWVGRTAPGAAASAPPMKAACAPRQ